MCIRDSLWSVQYLSQAGLLSGKMENGYSYSAVSYTHLDVYKRQGKLIVNSYVLHVITYASTSRKIIYKELKLTQWQES